MADHRPLRSPKCHAWSPKCHAFGRRDATPPVAEMPHFWLQRCHGFGTSNATHLVAEMPRLATFVAPKDPAGGYVKDYDELSAEKVAEAKSQMELLPKTLGADFVRRANLRVIESQKQRVEDKTPVQIPFWPEEMRAIPSKLARSALFSCVRYGGFVENEELAAWGDTKLIYTGQRLTQFDESLWLQLIHLHRGQFVGPDQQIHISVRALMRELGIKTAGGSGLRRLMRSLDKLRGALVTISDGDLERKLLAPVGAAEIDKGTGRFAVQILPHWELLLNEQATFLEWETRKALPTGLATWLHRYILSHRATARSPHRIGLEKLRALSGMVSAPKHFKHRLKTAMGKLQSRGVVESWGITPNNALEFIRQKKASKRLLTR
jgi:hypothetical protein